MTPSRRNTEEKGTLLQCFFLSNYMFDSTELAMSESPIPPPTAPSPLYITLL